MLASDPTEHQTIDLFKRDKILKEKNANELEIANLRTPIFYTIHKIHKAGILADL